MAPGPVVRDEDGLDFDRRSALSGLREWSDVLLHLSGLAEPPNDVTSGSERRARAQLEPLLSFSRVGASVYGRF